MARPGPRNLITDVPGIGVGHGEDRAALSGVTVILPAASCLAAVDVRGGAPGTRETDLLAPSCLVQAIDGIALAGGSVHGLAAADGMVAWLRAEHRGFEIAGTVMPIVPGAIIFDFPIGGDREWPEAPPYRRLAIEACRSAGPDFALGNAGAGLGATAGPLKGGLGSASAMAGDGLIVGALAVANPHGSVTMPGSGTLWAWTDELDGELGRQKPPGSPPPGSETPPPGDAGGNTTLAVVATNLALDKAEARRLAIMAQDGLARAIRPAHTPFDGDTVFVLSTGEAGAPEPGPQTLSRLGGLAADCVARAIARAVFEAEALAGWPAYRERWAGAFGSP